MSTMPDDPIVITADEANIKRLTSSMVVDPVPLSQWRYVPTGK